MSNGFDREEVANLLIKGHRRCCVCHRFCGSKMEIDHIVQRADGGGNEIENAIAVCFDCHAEIHHYNNKHPKGRKFTPEEIKGHKTRWLEICENKPEIFVQPLSADVGCL
jgi:5-methylcytosine-specific restriction endonuclease McrA